MKTFIERIKLSVAGKVAKDPYITLRAKDIMELVHHFERLDEIVRTKHKEEHPEFYPNKK